LGAALDHAQTMIVQSQFTNDSGLQKAERVCGRGVAEPRVELLRDTRAAHYLSAFLNVDLKAGHGQIGRTSQPIMASANYNYIEIDHDSAQKRFCREQGDH
jgi:hypothetical protein